MPPSMTPERFSRWSKAVLLDGLAPLAGISLAVYAVVTRRDWAEVVAPLVALLGGQGLVRATRRAIDESDDSDEPSSRPPPSSSPPSSGG